MVPMAQPASLAHVHIVRNRTDRDAAGCYAGCIVGDLPLIAQSEG